MAKGIWGELPSPFKEEVQALAGLMKDEGMLGDREWIEFHVADEQVYGPDAAERDRMWSAQRRAK